MKFLLKLKSWQLFIVLIIPFFISAFVPLVFPFTYYFLDSLWIITYLLWLLTLSLNINEKLPAVTKKNRQIAILQIILYLAILCFIFIPVSTAIIIPTWFETLVFLISYFGVIFVIVTTAWILTFIKYDQNQLVKNIILLWLYPFGIWIIQPKIKAFFDLKE